MSRFFYDLHIHSCLSPCADDDNTPNNIAGMASISMLNIVALTDHNTAKNCPAFFSAAERLGIIPIAGMELTTSEDIHAVCLFEFLEDALRFDEYLDGARPKIKNRPEFFGRQLIMDGEDNVIGEVEHLLSNATYISIDELSETVGRFGGICYPAHIDRDANGIISVLGAIPENSDFTVFELHDGARIDEFSEKYGIPKESFVISSDAHYLTDIRDGENFFELDCDESDPKEVRHQLFRLLGGTKI